jgi:hypothetical protein
MEGLEGRDKGWDAPRSGDVEWRMLLCDGMSGARLIYTVDRQMMTI